jgi:hypothetical protein
VTTQLLKNSTLTYDATSRPEYRIDKPGSSVTIEKPPFWEYVAEEVDGTLYPYSYHKDNGFELGGGNRKIRAGYAQNVTLKPGQRYLAKAVFTPEIYAEDGKPFDPDSVNVFFRLDGVQGGLTNIGRADHHVRKTVLFVFEVSRPGIVRVSFWLDCKWALREVKMRVHSIEILEVEKTYGTPVIVTPATVIETPAPPTPEPPASKPELPTPVNDKPEVEILKLIKADYNAFAAGLRLLAATIEDRANSIDLFIERWEKMK